MIAPNEKLIKKDRDSKQERRKGRPQMIGKETTGQLGAEKKIYLSHVLRYILLEGNLGINEIICIEN